jgi:RTX calcium-binding nonapeptide repeat (4 copies)
MDVLIQRWTHVDHLPELHADRVVTDRAIAALEMFMGDQLPPQNRRLLANSNHTMTANVASAYRHLKTAVSQQLMDQTDLPFLLQDLKMTWTGQQLTWDVQPMLSRLSQRFDAIANYPDALLDLVSVLGRVRTAGLQPVVQAAQEQSQRLTMVGTPVADYWNGLSDRPNRMEGRGGNDELNGGRYADLLDGGEGDDRLSGGAGLNILIGGRGDDALLGGVDDDVYRLSVGDGNDWIVETTATSAASIDVIEFSEGITLESLRFERVANDLVIHYGSDSDSVRLSRQFGSNPFTVEQIYLPYGSHWNLLQLIPSTAVTGV